MFTRGWHVKSNVKNVNNFSDRLNGTGTRNLFLQNFWRESIYFFLSSFDLKFHTKKFPENIGFTLYRKLEITSVCSSAVQKISAREQKVWHPDSRWQDHFNLSDCKRDREKVQEIKKFEIMSGRDIEISRCYMLGYPT